MATQIGKGTVTRDFVLGPKDVVSTSPSSTGGSTTDVQLRCGKGLPQVSVPLLKYDRPSARTPAFPTLEQLQKDVSDILKQAEAQVKKEINDSIGTELDTVNSGLGDISTAMNVMFSQSNTFTFTYASIFQGYVRDSRAVAQPNPKTYTGGAVRFKAEATLDNYNIYVSGGIKGFMERIDIVGFIFPILKAISEFEKAQSFKYNQADIDWRYSQSVKTAMENLYTDAGGGPKGVRLVFTGLVGIVKKLPTVIAKVLPVITDALTKVAQVLSKFAKDVATAVIDQVFNAVGEALEKASNSINSLLLQLDNVINSMVNTFNRDVLEPLQCSLKQAQDFVANFLNVFTSVEKLDERIRKLEGSIGVKFPGITFPGLPIPGFGESPGIVPWTVNVSKALSDLGNQIAIVNAKISYIDSRLTTLEKKVG